MEEIIQQIDIKVLKDELLKAQFLRKTNYGNRLIYEFTWRECPNLLQEVGRLREISFREAGGGTGKSLDLDEFDLSEEPYKQLIVWDSNNQEIIGGYRYLEGDKIPLKDSIPQVASSELFKFSPHFMKDYFPYMIELGRSFIQPKYQSKADRGSIFSLDNLWDGLGALIVNFPKMKYFFGKVTMYTSYNITARDYLLRFMQIYCPDKDNLITPIVRVPFQTDLKEIDEYFQGLTKVDAFNALKKKAREFDENLPPLISAYIKLSDTMKSFGTATNHEFGAVEETGILITIKDMHESKLKRYVNTANF